MKGDRQALFAGLLQQPGDAALRHERVPRHGVHDAARGGSLDYPPRYGRIHVLEGGALTIDVVAIPELTPGIDFGHALVMASAQNDGQAAPQEGLHLDREEGGRAGPKPGDVNRH